MPCHGSPAAPDARSATAPTGSARDSIGRRQGPTESPTACHTARVRGTTCTTWHAKHTRRAVERTVARHRFRCAQLSTSPADERGHPIRTLQSSATTQAVEAHMRNRRPPSMDARACGLLQIVHRVAPVRAENTKLPERPGELCRQRKVVYLVIDAQAVEPRLSHYTKAAHVFLQLELLRKESVVGHAGEPALRATDCRACICTASAQAATAARTHLPNVRGRSSLLIGCTIDRHAVICAARLSRHPRPGHGHDPASKAEAPRSVERNVERARFRAICRFRVPVLPTGDACACDATCGSTVRLECWYSCQLLVLPLETLSECGDG
jgi:hypothetical protein